MSLHTLLQGQGSAHYRLEREEKERLEKEKEEHEAKMKKRAEAAKLWANEVGGVVYKGESGPCFSPHESVRGVHSSLTPGRGSMRYRDPEGFSQGIVPPNFQPRGRGPRGGQRRDYDRRDRDRNGDRNGDRGRDGDREPRGGSDRDRLDRLDRDLDRYAHRGGNKGADMDDWRAGRIAPPEFSRGEAGDIKSLPYDGDGEGTASAAPRSPLRPESPPRGDRSDAGSDMVIDNDDD